MFFGWIMIKASVKKVLPFECTSFVYLHQNVLLAVIFELHKFAQKLHNILILCSCRKEGKYSLIDYLENVLPWENVRSRVYNAKIRKSMPENSNNNIFHAKPSFRFYRT